MGVVLWIVLSLHPVQATDYYVATNATPSSPYNTWSGAYTNVQDALNAATNGDTVYLAGHTFALTNQLVWNGTTNVTIRGGYAATTDTGLPGSNNPTLWPTRLVRSPVYTNRILTITHVITGTLSGVTLTGGWIYTNGNAYGGGVYISGSTGLLLSACVITNNIAQDTLSASYESRGGGIYSVSSIVTLSNCVVKANDAILGNSYGGGIYLASGSMTLLDSRIAHNKASSAYTRWGGAMYMAGTCLMRNCLVIGNSVMGGSGGCDGLYLASGALTVENCTVAGNTGQGLNRASGTAAVTNSILWGNGVDVVGSVSLGWSNSGNGTTNGINGCLSADPIFERGFYLATNSSCVGGGTNLASNLYLTNLTTRTDGGLDLSAPVTMGYHYPTGYDFSVGDYYVATNGDNGNSGTNAASPFRTLTKALSVAQDGTIIHVGAGSYTNNSESFPLSLTIRSGIQIRGTNQDTTVINAAGSVTRVMTLAHCANVLIAGLTFTGGNLTTNGSTYGSGISLSSCGGLVFSDCAITNNKIVNTTQGSGTGFGAGLYSESSVVTLSNCLVKANNNDGGNAKGGGISVANGILTLCDSVLANNASATTYNKLGGGIYNAGSCLLRNCLVVGNVATEAGAGIYSLGPLLLENCTVANNSGHGIHRGNGTASVTNSILWGNSVDLSGAVTVGWSDSGNGVTSGVNGCLSVDPLFERGFYLATNSPGVGQGANLASTLYLTNYTTRADGAPDTNASVTLGYHYRAGYESQYEEICVATNGSDGNSGTNMASPFRTITKAFSMAQDGSQITIGPGHYTNGSESFPLMLGNLLGVQILGAGRTTTVVNASGSNKRVMTLTGCNNLTVAAMTFTGGNLTTNGSSYGGGIYIANCGGVVLTDCVITNNNLVNTTQPSGTGYGGGVYVNGSLVTLSECLVRGNRNHGGNANGGGIYNVGGTLTLRNSIISSNKSVTTYTQAGGGVQNAGTCLMRNCLVVENVAPGSGAGLQGPFVLENCTVANNAGQGINGSGAATNSILWGNGDDIVGSVTLGYSNIEDGDNNTINGCISVDPMFVNTNAADYHLMQASPCVNSGTSQSWMAGAVDLEGNRRLISGVVDMGAYETILIGLGIMIEIR